MESDKLDPGQTVKCGCQRHAFSEKRYAGVDRRSVGDRFGHSNVNVIDIFVLCCCYSMLGLFGTSYAVSPVKVMISGSEANKPTGRINMLQAVTLYAISYFLRL